MALLLVRYGEIGVKSPPVKKRFERRLRENIQEKLRSEAVNSAVVRENNRFFVRVEESAVDAAVTALTYVPGIVSVSPVKKTGNDFEKIFAACKPFLQENEHVESFGLRTRRVGDHDFTSEDVAEEVGQMIVNHTGLDVDLDDPDLEIFIEVRYNDAYVYTEKIEGVGGLPVNRDYRVLAQLDSEADVVAAHLLQRRGCTVLPYTTTDTEQAQEWVGLLHAYDPAIKLVTADTSNVEELIDVFEVKAVCRGTTVETVKNGERDADGDILVLEPCSGMDQDEVRERFHEL